jgi:hypothetical protein
MDDKMIVIFAAFVFVIGVRIFLAVATAAIRAGFEMLTLLINAFVWMAGRWALKAEVKEQFAPSGMGPPYGIYVFDVVGEPKVHIALHACSRGCAQRLLSRVAEPRRIEACEGPGSCDLCQQAFS